MSKSNLLTLCAFCIVMAFNCQLYAQICTAVQKERSNRCELVVNANNNHTPLLPNANFDNVTTKTKTVKNASEKGTSVQAKSVFATHPLIHSMDKGNEHLISALHKHRSVNFNGKNPLTSDIIVIYDSNQVSSSKKRLSAKDNYNNFAKDVFYYNFFKYGVCATSPIGQIPILSYIKNNQGGVPISQVNEYIGVENYDFSVYFSTILGSDVKLGAYIATKKELAVSNVEYKNSNELNDSVMKEFGAIREVFESNDEKMQGFSYVNANFFWNEDFSKLNGLYKFFNYDNSYSNCEYMQGIVRGVISDDIRAFKILVNKNLTLEISKDLIKRGMNSYENNRAETMKVVLPLIKIKNAVKIEDIKLYGHERQISILNNNESFGNFYSITSFELSNEGLFFGENPNKNKQVDFLHEKEILGTPQTELTVDSSFRMTVYYKDIVIFEGIIDGSKGFEF